jgi:alpha-ketoglutarate-dependent taurine dioxygenase
MAAPDKIDDASVWRGTDFPTARDWVEHFSDEMVGEMDGAMRVFKATGKPACQVTPGDFPLPSCAALFEHAFEALDRGRGFAVLAGLPVDEYSYDENLILYCGIMCHLGRIVVQNYEGASVVDVIDKGIEYSHRARGYSSNKLLPFHTDGADFAGLMCLGKAVEGGVSLIASAAQVYNAIVAERPDVLDVLMRGFYHHRRGQHEAGENPLSPERVPVFAFHNALLHCCYNRNPMEWAETEGIRLSQEEIAALDFLDSVIARPEIPLSMQPEKGDIQIINNYLILHSRTGYTDGPVEKRHMVRVWLDNPRGLRNGYSLLDLYVPEESRFQAAE